VRGESQDLSPASCTQKSWEVQYCHRDPARHAVLLAMMPLIENLLVATPLMIVFVLDGAGARLLFLAFLLANPIPLGRVVKKCLREEIVVEAVPLSLVVLLLGDPSYNGCPKKNPAGSLEDTRHNSSRGTMWRIPIATKSRMC
jgi:hypothetical protein